MLRSNAQLIKELADKTKTVVAAGFAQKDEVAEILQHISDLIEPYISAEQRENEEAAALVQRIHNGKLIPHYDKELQPHATFDSDPGLSGHEMAAFETMKAKEFIHEHNEEVFGEDPELPITHDLH